MSEAKLYTQSEMNSVLRLLSSCSNVLDRFPKKDADVQYLKDQIGKTQYLYSPQPKGTHHA